MAGETLAENDERLLDLPPQLLECGHALGFRLLGPLLQPAGFGTVSLPWREARGVRHKPKQHEVGVDLAAEHGLEVELEEGLARQRLVVAQHPQAQTVRQQRPKVRITAIEELLYQAVRIGDRRATLSGRAAIQR